MTFLSLLGFEMRLYARRISTHVYFAIFALLGGFIAVAAGGAFKNVQVGIGGGQTHVNSPYVIFGLEAALSLFGVIVVAAISGNAVYRDFEAEAHPLFFTTPVSKLTYLASRFFGSFVANAYVMAGLPVGLAIGYSLPFLDEKLLGPQMPFAYVNPFLLVILPNLLFTGAIFFALASFTRQMLPNYLGGVLLLIGYLLASVFAANVENQQVAALLDPFGNIASDLTVRYWTPAQRNAEHVTLAGTLLWNRLLWCGVGLAVLAAMAARFKFKHVASEKTERKRERRDWEERSSEYQGALARREGLRDVAREFGARARVAQFASTVRRAFMGIVTNVYFIAIAAAGMLFLVLSSTQAGQLYGTATWPVTYQVIELLAGSFGLFVLIVITFYAGELAWQERDRRMNQVHDALPIPTWVPFLGKLSALVLVVLTLQCLLIACGLALQASKQYFRFEPMLYVKELLGLQLVNWALMIALIMLVHSLVNNKYLGHFIVILYFIGRGFLGRLGIEHLLFHYGSDPGTTYSDMNRFGPFLDPFAWYKLYWAGFAVLLAVLSNLFWVRGQETTAGWRLMLARQRFSRPALVFAAAGVVLALAAGGFIFWNTNVRNEYRTSFQQQELQARYERDYRQYRDLPQPRITGSVVDVTLWPTEHRGRLTGTLTAVNKTDGPIADVHVQLPPEADVAALTFTPPATRTKDDEELGYSIWELQQPLAPGATLTLQYDVSYAPEGFTNAGASTAIVDNGTFINSGLIPGFGYSENGELGDDDTRRKHGLPPKERMAPVDDLHARRNTYISSDADWIDFEATVCTDPDQLAIAPGYLEREFEREGRRCFEYKMDAPILNFYSFLSARYVVERDSWHDVAIEVWHHPGHEYNVKRMIDGTKAALEYYTTRFTPYQHRQLRIIEFPRYASFAQSFPNTIPYSESIGFIARVKDPTDDIDYPYYVTAHEVAHQWFAHQVIGGNVQGSTMLSESFSQYAALKVMEAAYGRATMVKFLKYERDNYLRGRAIERKKELPLLLVENQQYIHYNKGSVVLYAIADYIGEDRFNAALKTYIEKVRFQEPPYTNSLEFLAELRAVTPPDMQYLLDDMLVNITLYDLRTTSATAAKLADGTWEVVLEIDAKKLRADEEGNEVEVPMNDLVDVGAFMQGAGGKLQDLEPLAVERLRLVSGKQTIKLKTSRRPEKAGVNHRVLLLDRIDSDDIVKVEDPKS